MARLFRHEKASVFEVPMMRVFYCFMVPCSQADRQNGLAIALRELGGLLRRRLAGFRRLGAANCS